MREAPRLCGARSSPRALARGLRLGRGLGCAAPPGALSRRLSPPRRLSLSALHSFGPLIVGSSAILRSAQRRARRRDPDQGFDRPSSYAALSSRRSRSARADEVLLDPRLSALRETLNVSRPVLLPTCGVSRRSQTRTKRAPR